MPHLKVTLYLRITTAEGKRKLCKPVYASRGRLMRMQKATALDIIRRANTTSNTLAARKRSSIGKQLREKGLVK